MRILIAEDDPVSSRILEAYLTKWGYEIVVTHNGQEAWDVIQKEDAPKLAILDWMMPSMDGIALVRRLRQQPRAHYVYVILLTARDLKEDVIAGLEAGADDYLTKPFNKPELEARLRTGKRILDLQQSLLEAQSALREEATHDHLTKVWNRAGLMEILDREFTRALRFGSAVAIAVADLDYFKRVNDTHGHVVGDEVLQEVASRMLASVRGYDSVGRYGGEEFVVVLPECVASSALQQAERLRHGVSSKLIQTSDGLLSVTVSVGVAATDQADYSRYPDLLRSADAALYRAKTAGRNRTVLADPTDANVPVSHPV
ncbi:MAG: GGDEF domain-containing protein [Terriglobia bacterium]